MAEHHAERDVGRRREAAHDAARQELRERALERDPSGLGELQDPRRDERLDHASGTKAIARLDRDLRVETPEAARSGPAAASGLDTQDRAGDRVPERTERDVERLLKAARNTGSNRRRPSEIVSGRVAARDGQPSIAANTAPAVPRAWPSIEGATEQGVVARLALIVGHGSFLS